RVEKPVWRAALSPDEKRLLVVSGGILGAEEARVWDAVTGRPLSAPVKHETLVGPGWAEFSPDGRRVLTADDSQARVWDAATGARVWGLEPGRAWDAPWRLAAKPSRVAFSPDGARALVADERGAVQVWDVFRGTPLLPPVRVGGDVTEAAFSPDGRFLLAAGR